jgi:hypothetical protein
MIDLMANLMKENIIINADIERDVLKQLLDHCFCEKMKETESYSVLNEVYVVAFELSEDILMERINSVGFGMNKKRIPSCSYAKVNEVKKDNYKYYTDLSESNEPITLCCLSKNNCMYSYQDNPTEVNEHLNTNLKVESSVVFTTGGNFSYFHIDTYGSSRISIISEWNRGLYKIWIFYCHETIKDKAYIKGAFNHLRNTKDQIHYVLNNSSKFEFYLQTPSNKSALMHKGSHYHCVLTMYDKTISTYGACLSIGLRIIYEDCLTEWLRNSDARIGVQNLPCSRKQLIKAACTEIFTKAKAEKSKYIKVFESLICAETLKRKNQKAKKRKRKQIGEFLSEARKLAQLRHCIEEKEDYDEEEEEEEEEGEHETVDA